MIPRKGATASSSEAVGQQEREDDGYLVTFLIDENTGTSECAILDASDIAKGPICRLALPHKLSSGTHSVWVEHEQLRKDAAFRAARLGLTP
jgi:carotenoid cleavage dioxygenase-like enzyme